jgi:hypothetical protein
MILTSPILPGDFLPLWALPAGQCPLGRGRRGEDFVSRPFPLRSETTIQRLGRSGMDEEGSSEPPTEDDENSSGPLRLRLRNQ